jgi:hypothetical protein
MRIVSLCIVCLAALLLIAQPSMAVSVDWATIVLNPGDNWVASPVVPFDSAPASVFSGIDLNSNLTYWDPLQQQTIVYDSAHPEKYSPVLMGDGYIVRNAGSSAVICRYQGVNIGDTDAYIPLYGAASGGGGMNWIGISYMSDVLIDNVVVTNGSESGRVGDAIQWGWLAPTWTTMNSATQTIERVGMTGQQGADTNWLRSGHMYKVQTYQSNLAFILPHPVPEPATLPALFCALGGVATMLRRPRRRK